MPSARLPGNVKRHPLSDRHLDIESRIKKGERQADIARSLGMKPNAVQRALLKITEFRSVERMRSAGRSVENCS